MITQYLLRTIIVNFFFDKPYRSGDLTVGATIFTTLELCLFCTSALLVTRMKRIIYIITDPDFGGAFNLLKENFMQNTISVMNR